MHLNAWQTRVNHMANTWEHMANMWQTRGKHVESTRQTRINGMTHTGCFHCSLTQPKQLVLLFSGVLFCQGSAFISLLLSIVWKCRSVFTDWVEGMSQIGIRFS